MRTWRILACAGMLTTFATVASTLGAVPLPAHAETLARASLSDPLPPHLGYGINVRDPGRVDSLFAPLGFEWLKLWEEYGSEQNPTIPQIRYPYQVLFLIDCTQRSDDLDAWANAVEAIAVAGRGLVEAYEICNEPNRVGWLDRDGDAFPPDPYLYSQMLEVAHAHIKAVDPGAIVVSAGLAPVGRIEGTCDGWAGNNCAAMDEREYARHMLLLGAGDHFDAFGYHPYGFAYEPERALDALPPDDNGNGFAFRGAEVMHDLLEQHGQGHKPIWATEFGWLRDPSEDGRDPDWCHRREEYEPVFGWMDIPEIQQANYITRSFQYADENWPWMGAMFVWNLDWHDYGWLCEPARYFSVLRVDYEAYDLPPILMEPTRSAYRAWEATAPSYATTLAYDALVGMEKRPGHFGPRLALAPPSLSLLADLERPGPSTGVVVPLNTGYGVFTWTATVAGGMGLTPTLAITTGQQSKPLTITVDSTGYPSGTFTGVVSVTSTTSNVLDAAQAVTVTLRVLSDVYRVYLPLTLRSAP